MWFQPLERRLLLTTVSVAPATVSEDSQQAVFAVSLDAPAPADITLSYRTASQTARAGRDFIAERGSVVIPAGQTSAAFDVAVLEGGSYEPEETFAVALRASPGTTLSAKRVVATVVDDDPAPTVSVMVSHPDNQVVEPGAGETRLLTASLRISTYSDQPIRVTYQTVDGSATAAGGDYRPTRGVVTFRPFQRLPSSQTPIKLVVLGDDVQEGPESFSLQFATTSPGITIDPASIDATVFDDDSPVGVPPFVSVAVHNPEIEGTPGVSHEPGPPVTTTPPSRGSFLVQLSSAGGALLPTVPVTVAYATGDGTATAGVDYQPASGVLTFAPGETMKSVFADPIADAVDEFDETFTLTLSEPVNCNIVDGVATMTIPDDDVDVNPDPPPAPPPGPPVVPEMKIHFATLVEGNLVPAIPDPIPGTTTLLVPVTLSVGTSATVTVAYTTGSTGTGDGHAMAGIDYAATQGTLTFVPTETLKFISIAVPGDVEIELDETFTVTLSNVVGATLTTSVAVMTIVNDDFPPT